MGAGITPEGLGDPRGPVAWVTPEGGQGSPTGVGDGGGCDPRGPGVGAGQ